MIGVILAGGRSSRMGTDKATFAVAGRPMLEWVAAALAESCEEVVVAGREHRLADLQPLPDPGRSHQGPLAGLVTALRHRPGHDLALVAVDQPWVQSETLRRLGRLVGELAAVPVEGGVRQTTCAVYPPQLRAPAEEELAGGGSLQSLLDVAAFEPVVDWRGWGEDGRSWFSVDTAEDVEEGLARFGVPG